MLMEHIARIKDVELLSGMSFFTKWSGSSSSSDVKAATIRRKLWLPEFQGQWMSDFLSKDLSGPDPTTPSVDTTSSSAVNTPGMGIILALLFWSLRSQKLGFWIESTSLLGKYFTCCLCAPLRTLDKFGNKGFVYVLSEFYLLFSLCFGLSLETPTIAVADLAIPGCIRTCDGVKLLCNLRKMTLKRVRLLHS